MSASDPEGHCTSCF